MRQGVAWHGKARLGKARQARYGIAWRGGQVEALLGRVVHGMAGHGRQGSAGQGEEMLGGARRGVARHGMAWQGRQGEENFLGGYLYEILLERRHLLPRVR